MDRTAADIRRKIADQRAMLSKSLGKVYLPMDDDRFRDLLRRLDEAGAP